MKSTVAGAVVSVNNPMYFSVDMVAVTTALAVNFGLSDFSNLVESPNDQDRINLFGNMISANGAGSDFTATDVNYTSTYFGKSFTVLVYLRSRNPCDVPDPLYAPTTPIYW